MDESRKRIRRVVAQRLESFELAGVTHVAKAKRTAVSIAPATVEAKEKNAGQAGQPNRVTGEGAERKAVEGIAGRSLFDASSAPATMLPEQKPAALDVIRCEVAACVRCKILAETRTQTVFGVGNPNAKICFFGEAPGADEDRLGEPFVGRGGQLLNKMLAACGLKREEVYILNVLKCRPPENRNPLPDEVTNCRGYFERQFDIIRPEIICCLGAVASRSLLKTELAIGKLRGKIHDYRGIPVVCSYHPAYLLRNPPAKADAWEDLKLMMRQQGVEL